MADFTPQQEEAIRTVDRNVAVSAGAGSGKTRVLVERFMHILRRGLADPGLKADASEIVAITFTRKAAGEMKARIRRAMEEEAARSDGAFWRGQLEALERAQITTIHSVCSRILRENPVEAELDPGFVLAEDFEGREFLLRCLKDYVRRGLQQEDAGLKTLADAYGSSLLLQMMEDMLPHLSSLREMGGLKRPYEESAARLPALKEEFCSLLREAAAQRDKYASPKTALYGRLEELEASLADLVPEISREPAGAQAMARALELTSVRGRLKEEYKELLGRLKTLRDEINGAEADILALPLIGCWEKTLDSLAAYIRSRKLETDFLDYDDLEIMALELLHDENIRRKYRQKFRYLMVDEFQDTNDRQRRIIYLLCGDSEDELQGSRLFIVGDPKQSIYRFRGADVSVFARVRREIQKRGGAYITLTRNFRSVDKVLESCNAAFSRLLGTDEKKDVFYEALEFHRESDVRPVLLEIPVTREQNGVKRRLEAGVIAKEMLKLHEEGVPYGDMAVLLSAMTHSDTLGGVLQRYGIPFEIVDGRGFYGRQEVLDLLHLFAALHNRYRSLELAGVLRSPYFGLDDESLTRLFLQRECLWDSLQQADADTYGSEQGGRIRRAAAVLAELRCCAAVSGAAELWRQAWKLLHIDAVLTLQEYGSVKLANARKLRQLCLDYCGSHGCGIGAWLDYVARLRQAGQKETSANMAAGDAVSIMTIHKSKGLEFGTVFLPMLDAKGRGDMSQIRFEQSAGLGIKVPDADGQLLETGVYREAAAKNKKLELEERIRRLYVAMTRAENRLIMSGCFQDLDKEKDLEEMDWLQQLHCIFRNSGEVEIRTAEPEAEEPAEQALAAGHAADIEALRRTEPLPLYLQPPAAGFSPSALQTYLRCQRQYFYQMVMQLPGLEEAAEESRGLPASVTGLIVHKALELYRGGDLRGAFEKAVHEYNNGSFAGTVGAWDMLQRYTASSLYAGLSEGRLREVEFTLPAEEGPALRGIIDCVDFCADGTAAIVDYKTGRPPEDGEVCEGYALQLAVYRAAAEKIFHTRVSSARLHFLQNLSFWELPGGGEYLQRALDLCREIGGKTREDEFSCSLASCAFCHYNYLCPKK